MEKIILLSDVNRIDTSTINFGCYLAKLTDAKLVGVLLQNPFDSGYKRHYEDIFASEKSNTDSDDVVVMDTDQSILYFTEQTRKCKIRSTAFFDEGTPEVVSLYESRFADLLLLAPDLSFNDDHDSIPSDFVKYLLLKSDCPVVLAPRSFNTISRITFCYDGSSSAIFAIKQFTYLFPQYKKMPVSVLVIRTTENQKEEKYDRIITWLHANYEHLELCFLHGNVEDELFPYFINKKDTFIVMGSFGRNIISYFVRKSVSEMVIKMIDLPLFISHH